MTTLEQLNSKFEATDQAFPTSRVVENPAVEEWSEVGEINGQEATRYYLFSKSDITYDCGTPVEVDHYPFDADHVSRIILS